MFQNVRVDSHHQHLFIIRAVKNPNMAAFGKNLGSTPQEIVVQIFRRGLLKRINLTTLRIHSRHDMLDEAIFASRVHGLKNHQNRPTVLGIELVLERSHFIDAFIQQLLRVLVRAKVSGIRWIEIFQPKFRAIINSIWLRKLAGPAHATSIQ